MKQVTQNLGDGRVRVVEVPVPIAGPHSVLVRVERSLVSVGTERAKVELGRSSLLEKARRRPDDVKKVLDRVRRDGLLSTYKMVKGRLEQDSPLGYSVAGKVVGVGELVAGIRTGDRVACAGAGYANHAEMVSVPGSLCARVPDDVTADSAAYTTLGAIAMQGVRQANVTFGDTVLIIGLGLLGLIATQIAKAAGCIVIGFDLDESKVALALACGADAAVSGGHDDVAAVTELMTAGRGADAVIITASTRSSEPVRLAGQVARDRAPVVVVGDVGMDVPRSPFYEKELSLHLSRSYGPGRYDPLYEEFGIDYPDGYVRWTERRNMEEFLRLVSVGAIRTDLLTTHRFSIDDAPAAYDLIVDADAEPVPVGVLLEYSSESAQALTGTKAQRPVRDPSGQVGIGMIGAGNFATSTLVPALKRQSVDLRGIATATGLRANDVAERDGFAFAAADAADLLADAATSGVVIATRHETHARLAADVLCSGRHVFCEKPLALTREELDEVVAAWLASSADCMVGFNRRYSPMARTIREALDALGAQATIQIRVNAGRIPEDHWIQRLEQGGGRIVGEMCHFVDLAAFLGGGEVRRVAAFGLDNGKSPALQDSLVVSMVMGSGSVASITYCAEGDPAVSKESVEVFSAGRTWLIDDFRTLTIAAGGKVVKRDGSTVDKGHNAEIASFVALCRGEVVDESGRFEYAVASMDATFAVVEALSSGCVVDVPSRGLARG